MYVEYTRLLNPVRLNFSTLKKNWLLDLEAVWNAPKVAGKAEVPLGWLVEVVKPVT